MEQLTAQASPVTERNSTTVAVSRQIRLRDALEARTPTRV
jgi:hypothetical protein